MPNAAGVSKNKGVGKAPSFGQSAGVPNRATSPQRVMGAASGIQNATIRLRSVTRRNDMLGHTR